MYCRICTIGFLSALCSARISLNDASKKAYLICENSVKTGKTQVSQILQRYAQDHPYQDKFPSHLREASDYFESKYMELVQDFAIQLNQKNRQEKLDYANTTGKQVLDIINNDSPNTDNGSHRERDSGSVHSNTSLPTDNNNSSGGGGLPSTVTHSLLKDITNCDGNLNAISMSIDQFNKLAEFLKGMITNQKSQQDTIEDLVNRVQNLETQQQRILNDVTTNSSNSSPTTGFNNTPPYLQQQSTNTSSNTSSASMVPPYVQSLQHAAPHLMMNNRPNYPQPRLGFLNTNQTAHHNNNNINNNLPPNVNQGGSSPSTKTTTSTTSLLSNTQNFMNSAGDHSNGANHMNMNMNLNHNAMNNNSSMLRMPPMGQLNNNGFSISQLTNPALLLPPQHQPPPHQQQQQQPPPQQQQQQERSQPQQAMNGHHQNYSNMHTNNHNNQNNRVGIISQDNPVDTTRHHEHTANASNNHGNGGGHNNAAAIPSGLAGTATPAANMNVHLQPTNTLNSLNSNGALPSTSLNGGGLMSFGSEDFAFCNSQSFNSSDAGMTNMMSIPNNLHQPLSSHQIPLDSGGFRLSDQSINFPNQYNA